MGMIVDDRQHRTAPRIYEILLKNLTLKHLTVSRMEFADYAFKGKPINGTEPNVGIEHCTLNDFLGKITSGRLSFQGVGLIGTYNVPVLLVQGLVKKDTKTDKVLTYGYDTPHSYAAVQGVIFSAEMHGIKWVNVETVDEAGLEIVRLYRYFQEDPSAHKFFRESIVEIGANEAEVCNYCEHIAHSSNNCATSGCNCKYNSNNSLRMPIGGGIDRAVKSLMALSRDIGEVRALAALKWFGSLDAVITRNPQQLIKVPGWGPKVAKDFYEAVTKYYGSDS